MSGFLGAGVPVFEIREVAGDTDMLVRNPALGAALALRLDDKPAALMRGHGSVAVGISLPQAVFRAVYLEVNARLQSEAMKLGSINFLTSEEARLASCHERYALVTAVDALEARGYAKESSITLEKVLLQNLKFRS